MRFIVSSSALLKQLSALNGVIASNPIIPILENFLFTFEDNSLTITASDVQNSMKANMSVDTEGSGNVAIPAKMLMDTLRNLPEQPVTFSFEEESFGVSILSSNGTYKLAGEDGADFPVVQEVTNGSAIELSSELIQSAIAYTLFAVSNDDMRPSMNGVFVKFDSKGATFVSTDSHRLVRYIRSDVESGIEASFILPKKALALLKNSLPNDDISVKVSFNKSNAFFAFNNIEMVCRLIDERFPDYENVIPLHNSNELRIDRQELLASLKRIAIYANKSTNQVRLKLQGESLDLSAEDLDFSNEAKESLVAEYDGEEMEIGFNAKFLMDSLSNIHAPQAVMKMSEPRRAALMIPSSIDKNEDVLMLIMPVMLRDYYN